MMNELNEFRQTLQAELPDLDAQDAVLAVQMQSVVEQVQPDAVFAAQLEQRLLAAHVPRQNSIWHRIVQSIFAPDTKETASGKVPSSAEDSAWQTATTSRAQPYQSRYTLGALVGLAALALVGAFLWPTMTPSTAPQANKPSAPMQVNRATSMASRPTASPTPRLSSTPNPGLAQIGELSLLHVEYLSSIEVGKPFTVNIHWHINAVPKRNGTFFVHLTNPLGNLISQVEIDSSGYQSGISPINPGFPAGIDMIRTYQLAIPANAPFGEYDLNVGIYDPANGERWSVISKGKAVPDQQAFADSFLLPRKGWGPMMWPVQSRSIVQGYWSGHQSLDLQETEGQPVFATMRGCIIRTNKSESGYGNVVVLKIDVESADLQVRYSHLGALYVRPGDCVAQGDILGEVAVSPDSTVWPYIRFEVLADGQTQNPWDSLTDPISYPTSNGIVTTPVVRSYIVQAGDTCAGIAHRFKIDLESLMARNGLDKACGNLFVGRQLIFPAQITPQPRIVVTVSPHATK